MEPVNPSGMRMVPRNDARIIDRPAAQQKLHMGGTNRFVTPCPRIANTKKRAADAAHSKITRRSL